MYALSVVTRRLQSICTYRRIVASPFSSKKDKNSGDPASETEQENKNKSTKKLNDLLKRIVEEDVPAASKSTLKLAKPINRRNKTSGARKAEKSEKKFIGREEKLLLAAKDVANTIGGDVKKTESELLNKLLSPVQKKVKESSISDILTGMKVEKEQKTKENRADTVRKILSKVQTGSKDQSFRSRLKPRREVSTESVTLFSTERLSIFSENVKDHTEGVQNVIWNHLYERDMKLAVTHPSRNYFQEMVLLTEQGKIWKFPIDNEQGLEEEQAVYFADHIFLEKCLDSWCPPKGPLRHFMELVCVGLSKNSFLTVEAKREHIDWFKNYFEDKKQLLRDVGALQEKPGPQIEK